MDIRMRSAPDLDLHQHGLVLTYPQNPTALTLQQQKDILDHTYDQLTKFNNGIPPKGYVAPWCEMSAEVTRLLLDKGVEWGELAFRCADIVGLIVARSLTYGTRVRCLETLRRLSLRRIKLTGLLSP